MQSADAGKMLARLAAIAALLAGAGVYGAHGVEGRLEERSGAVAGTGIQVHPGASLRAVLGELARVGAVPHPRRVEWELRLHGESLRALAGSYELAPGETVRQILAQLNAGQVVLEQLTIVEGWTFAQLRQAFDASSTLTHEWGGLEDGKLMAALGPAGVAPEGRFFPDTYRYAAGTSDRRLYELAMQRMQEHLQQEWAAREPNLPLADAHAALILASIIAKGTAREAARNKLAAVFLHRLPITMRLHSDPTIIYGLGRSFDGNLRRRDLETDRPHNRHTRGGLPPTPSAPPGHASPRPG